MIRFKFKKLFVTVVGLACVSVANAQDQAASIKIGESDLSPSLGIGYLSNNNAFLTPDNETSVTGVEIFPRLELVTRRRLLQLSLVYNGNFAVFSEDELDFDNHRLNFNANADLSTRQRVRASLKFSNEDQPLGTRITRGIGDEDNEQIELNTFGLEASYVYGARSAKGNIEVGLRLNNTNFLNEADLTDGLDFTEVGTFGVFSYRLSSDSRLLFEGRISDLSFDDETTDRTDLTALVGISLGENRKTSGSARVGFSQASFELDGRADEQTSVADILLTWMPVNFSTFNLALTREFINTDSAAVTGAVTEVTIGDTIRLDWIHEWSTRLTTEAFAAREASDRECPQLDTATTSAGVEIAFSLRRWLILGGRVSTASRTEDDCPEAISGQDDLEFDRQAGSVFLRVTL